MSAPRFGAFTRAVPLNHPPFDDDLSGDGGPKPTKHQECATPLPPQPDTSGGHAVHRPSTTASIFAKAPAEVRLRELGCRSASTGDLGEIVVGFVSCKSAATALQPFMSKTYGDLLEGFGMVW